MGFPRREIEIDVLEFLPVGIKKSIDITHKYYLVLIIIFIRYLGRYNFLNPVSHTANFQLYLILILREGGFFAYFWLYSRPGKNIEAVLNWFMKPYRFPEAFQGTANVMDHIDKKVHPWLDMTMMVSNGNDT